MQGSTRLVAPSYLFLFFVYLLTPMGVLVVTAFNTSAYPRVVPFEGLTLHWFFELAQDETMLYGLRNSLWIGCLVVLVSVPIGLAGAIFLQQIDTRIRPFVYVVMIAPVLIPGVIIGIATVIFWRDVTLSSGLRFLYDGTVLTVLGQSSFISAYCMLLFTARLQRFDHALTEAAFDLGAGHTQVFFHILLPFLRPAILSASALAFLSSFENYNTTTFAILSDKTLTTVLAGYVRQGTSPTISALAVTIIAVTVVVSLIYDGLHRRVRGRSPQDSL
jgi:spermidine/putrescine transport system permease protein